VDPRGDVYACPFVLAEEFRAGNVRDASFASIWSESPLFDRLRGWEVGGQCRTCGAYGRCHGGCMAVKHFTGTPLDDPDPEVVTAATATRASLANIEMEEHLRLARQYLRLEPRASKAWRDAASMASYSLRLTPEELESLAKALDAAIRPFIGLTRNDPPESAQPVHLDFKAFLRPEALT